MSTLYRQYRPQSFAEVFGQSHIKITFPKSILKCSPKSLKASIKSFKI